MLVFDVLGIRDERLIWCVYEQLEQILLLLPFKLNLKPQWSSQISFAMKLPVEKGYIISKLLMIVNQKT